MNKITGTQGVRLYTPEMFEDLQRSSNDATYFIETHLGVDVTGMGDMQEDEITQNPHLTLKQMCAYVVWSSIFQDNRTSVVVVKSSFRRRKANYVVRSLFEKLPEWMRPNFVDELITRLTLVNRSRIFFQIADPYIIKGMTVSLIVFEKYDDLLPRLREEMMMNIWPTLCHGTQVIVDAADPLMDM